MASAVGENWSASIMVVFAVAVWSTSWSVFIGVCAVALSGPRQLRIHSTGWLLTAPFASLIAAHSTSSFNRRNIPCTYLWGPSARTTSSRARNLGLLIASAIRIGSLSISGLR